MKDWMDSVLTPLIAPERKEVLLSCIGAFEQLDYQAALDEIQQVVEMSGSNCDNAMLLSRIDDIVWYAHETIFKQHMLKISTDATQAVRQAVVDVLMGIDVYIMPEHVVGLFEAKFTPEEILSDLVELMTPVMADDVWPHIEWIDPRLMESIESEVRKQVMYRTEAVDPGEFQSRIRLLNKFFRIVGRDRFSIVNDLSKNGVRVGTVEFTSLLLQSLETIERMPMADRAIETFGLALMSNLPLSKLNRTMHTAITDLTDGGMGLGEMQKLIKPLLAEVDKENEDT
jgi:hypothetical protein